MKKSDIVALVNSSGADKQLKEMVLGYVDLAFDAGFQEGMICATKIQSEAFDMLTNSFNPKKGS